MVQERQMTYAKAFTELTEIINYFSDELKNKIPSEMKKNILSARDTEYIFKYDKNLPLYKQNILPETKNLLSIIYSDYLCEEEERKKWEEYDRFCINKQNEKKSEKYATNLFNKQNKKEQKLDLVEVKENNIIKRIIAFIKRKDMGIICFCSKKVWLIVK